jgi:hypothetical protein
VYKRQFSSRIGALIGQLSPLTLDRLEPTNTALMPAAATIVISEQTTPELVEPTLTLYRQGESLLAAYQDLPAQFIPPARAKMLLTLIDSFTKDQLVEIERVLNLENLEQVEFTKGGGRWFELNRASYNLVTEVSLWDVVWPGGRERATDAAGAKLRDLLSRMIVSDTTRAAGPLSSATAIQIRMKQKRQDDVIISIDGELAAFGDFRGRLDSAEDLVAALQPERFLDLRLTRRSGDRVVKLQRVRRDVSPRIEETYARPEEGAWRKTFPAGVAEVDPAAVDRLVRALCLALASEVRLEQASDRRTIDAPDIEISTRFAAVPHGEACLLYTSDAADDM